MKKSLKRVFLTSFLTFSSCASIVIGNNQGVPLWTFPEGAKVVVRDEDEKIIFEGKTPTRVTLGKKHSYFGARKYTAEFSHPGYHTEIVPIKNKLSDWYLFGNLFGFNVIGWLIVDPLTGSMWTLSPDRVTADLKSKGSRKGHEKGANQLGNPLGGKPPEDQDMRPQTSN